MTGFETYTDETLIKTHRNLLKGLDKVAASMSNGSFNTVGEKGEASPSQSGGTTLSFLILVSLELALRGIPSVAVDLDKVIREVNYEH